MEQHSPVNQMPSRPEPTNASADDLVIEVAHCRLRVEERTWAFAEQNKDEIDWCWAIESRDNPQFFNGTVMLLANWANRDGFEGVLLPSEFKSVLYWRHLNFPETGVRDGFGSALIETSDGAIILGRQKPGNLNSGKTYLPGGFIDPRDCDDDGFVDIAASVQREVLEETGLTENDLTRDPDRYTIAFSGPHVSIAVRLIAKATADQIIPTVQQHIAQQSDPELEDVTAVFTSQDLDRLDTPRYARTVLHHWLAKKQLRQAR